MVVSPLLICNLDLTQLHVNVREVKVSGQMAHFGKFWGKEEGRRGEEERRKGGVGGEEERKNCI